LNFLPLASGLSRQRSALSPSVLATARAIVENNLVLIRRLAFQLFLRGEIDRAVIRELLCGHPKRRSGLARRGRAAA
jgi:hypothetical protein